MTHDELREAAVKAAKRMREAHRDRCRAMFPHAIEEELWVKATDRGCILSRYVLSLHDETPVDRGAAADAVYELIDKRDAIRTAGQLRMMGGVLGK